MKICVVFHCLFFLGEPPQFLPGATAIVYEQMNQLRSSGLLDACDEMIVGCNGDEESRRVAEGVIPTKAKLVMHGLESRNENLTLVELEKWSPSHPGWAVLYFHAKGSSWPPGSEYGEKVDRPWRSHMMQDMVVNWKRCVEALQLGYDIACSSWLWNAADGTQHVPAGNFLWIKSDFVAKLPSIYLRDRIKLSGIGSLESRYESEVYWGNGPKPTVRQYRPGWRPWDTQKGYATY